MKEQHLQQDVTKRDAQTGGARPPGQKSLAIVEKTPRRKMAIIIAKDAIPQADTGVSLSRSICVFGCSRRSPSHIRSTFVRRWETCRLEGASQTCVRCTPTRIPRPPTTDTNAIAMPMLSSFTTFATYFAHSVTILSPLGLDL